MFFLFFSLSASGIIFHVSCIFLQNAQARRVVAAGGWLPLTPVPPQWDGDLTKPQSQL